MKTSGGVELLTSTVYRRCPSDGRLGWPESRSGCGVEEKKPCHCPCRVLNTGCPGYSLVSVLSYPGSQTLTETIQFDISHFVDDLD
jgi:hypothetical protein